MPAAAICLLITACSGATATPAATNPTTAVPQGSASTPLPTLSRPTAGVPPTPHPDTSDWVNERLDAVIALYQPTEAGELLLRSLDLRKMEGEPGFFGSYGFSGWAGVGEASPIGVIHELGHSYWSRFPVAGAPELSWVRTSNDRRSPAMERYHQDILAFMAQPPYDYELFRQRLRNLPDVSRDNPEPVLHNLEADVTYNTAGSLNLVRPVRRLVRSGRLVPVPISRRSLRERQVAGLRAPRPEALSVLGTGESARRDVGHGAVCI